MYPPRSLSSRPTIVESARRSLISNKLAPTGSPQMEFHAVMIRRSSAMGMGLSHCGNRSLWFFH
jgi:hypothetical protein